MSDLSSIFDDPSTQPVDDSSSAPPLPPLPFAGLGNLDVSTGGVKPAPLAPPVPFMPGNMWSPMSLQPGDTTPGDQFQSVTPQQAQQFQGEQALYQADQAPPPPLPPLPNDNFGKILGWERGLHLPSGVQSFVDSAAQAVVPTAAGVAGGALTGAAVGSVVPGIGNVVGGIIGGIAGGIGGGYVQGKVMDTLMSPEDKATWQAQLAEDQKNNAVAQQVGSLAPQLAFFRPSPATLSGAVRAAGQWLRTKSTAGIAAQDLEALTNVAFGEGTSVGQSAWSQIQAGHFDPVQTAVDVVAGAFLNKPTELAHMLGVPREVIHQGVQGMHEAGQQAAPPIPEPPDVTQEEFWQIRKQQRDVTRQIAQETDPAKLEGLRAYQSELQQMLDSRPAATPEDYQNLRDSIPQLDEQIKQAQESGDSVLAESLGKQKDEIMGHLVEPDPALVEPSTVAADISADPKVQGDILTALQANAGKPLTAQVTGPAGSSTVPLETRAGYIDGALKGILSHGFVQDADGTHHIISSVDKITDADGKTVWDNPSPGKWAQTPEITATGAPKLGAAGSLAARNTLGDQRATFPPNARTGYPITADQPHLQTISGGRFSDIPKQSGAVLPITPEDTTGTITSAMREQPVPTSVIASRLLPTQDPEGSLIIWQRDRKGRLQVNRDGSPKFTVNNDFLVRALARPTDQRYDYEQYAEGLMYGNLLQGLTPDEQRFFVNTAGVSSQIEEVKVGIIKALSLLSEHIRGVPPYTDMISPAKMESAIRGGMLDDSSSVKLGSFTHTPSYLMGFTKEPPFPVQDRWMARLFGLQPEAFDDPKLVSTFNKVIFDLTKMVNDRYRQDAEPFQPWQLQALLWHEAGGSGSQSDGLRQAAQEILDKSGGKLPMDRDQNGRPIITRETLNDKSFAALARDTYADAQARHVYTMEAASGTPIGIVARQQARTLGEYGTPAALKLISERHAIHLDAMQAVKLALDDAIRAITGRSAAYNSRTEGREIRHMGSFQGHLEVNLSVPLLNEYKIPQTKAQKEAGKDVKVAPITDLHREGMLAMAGKALNQDAVAAPTYRPLLPGETPTGDAIPHVWIDGRHLSDEELQQFTTDMWKLGFNIRVRGVPNGDILYVTPQFDEHGKAIVIDPQVMSDSLDRIGVEGQRRWGTTDFNSRYGSYYQESGHYDDNIKALFEDALKNDTEQLKGKNLSLVSKYYKTPEQQAGFFRSEGPLKRMGVDDSRALQEIRAGSRYQRLLRVQRDANAAAERRDQRLRQWSDKAQDHLDQVDDKSLHGEPTVRVKGVKVEPPVRPNLEAKEAARQYTESAGMPAPVDHAPVPVDKERATQVGHFYDSAPVDATNPRTPQEQQWVDTVGAKIFSDYAASPRLGPVIQNLGITDYPSLVRASFSALQHEVMQQYKHLPIKIEWWTENGKPNGEPRTGQPYASSREMMKDVQKNGRLKVFTAGEPHPLLDQATSVADAATTTQLLRGIHDYFGHAAGAHQFGPRGEENAWLEHSKMFSPLAQIALTTETRGQNSWVNFFGDHPSIPAADRPYADQKVFILPPEMTDHQAVLRSSPPSLGLPPSLAMRSDLPTVALNRLDHLDFNSMIAQAAPTAPQLFRGIHGGDYPGREFRVGTEHVFPAESWSASDGVAGSYASVARDRAGGGIPVVFILPEGARAIDASKHGYKDLQEWVTGGTFKVVKKENGPNSLNVYLEQVAAPNAETHGYFDLLKRINDLDDQIHATQGRPTREMRDQENRLKAIQSELQDLLYDKKILPHETGPYIKWRESNFDDTMGEDPRRLLKQWRNQHPNSLGFTDGVPQSTIGGRNGIQQEATGVGQEASRTGQGESTSKGIEASNAQEGSGTQGQVGSAEDLSRTGNGQVTDGSSASATEATDAGNGGTGGTGDAAATPTGLGGATGLADAPPGTRAGDLRASQPAGSDASGNARDAGTAGAGRGDGTTSGTASDDATPALASRSSATLERGAADAQQSTQAGAAGRPSAANVITRNGVMVSGVDETNLAAANAILDHIESTGLNRDGAVSRIRFVNYRSLTGGEGRAEMAKGLWDWADPSTISIDLGAVIHPEEILTQLTRMSNDLEALREEVSLRPTAEGQHALAVAEAQFNRMNNASHQDWINWTVEHELAHVLVGKRYGIDQITNPDIGDLAVQFSRHTPEDIKAAIRRAGLGDELDTIEAFARAVDQWDGVSPFPHELTDAYSRAVDTAVVRLYEHMGYLAHDWPYDMTTEGTYEYSFRNRADAEASQARTKAWLAQPAATVADAKLSTNTGRADGLASRAAVGGRDPTATGQARGLASRVEAPQELDGAKGFIQQVKNATGAAFNKVGNQRQGESDTAYATRVVKETPYGSLEHAQAIAQGVESGLYTLDEKGGKPVMNFGNGIEYPGTASSHYANWSPEFKALIKGQAARVVEPVKAADPPTETIIPDLDSEALAKSLAKKLDVYQQKQDALGVEASGYAQVGLPGRAARVIQQRDAMTNPRDLLLKQAEAKRREAAGLVEIGRAGAKADALHAAAANMERIAAMSVEDLHSAHLQVVRNFEDGVHVLNEAAGRDVMTDVSPEKVAEAGKIAEKKAALLKAQQDAQAARDVAAAGGGGTPPGGPPTATGASPQPQEPIGAGTVAEAIARSPQGIQRLAVHEAFGRAFAATRQLGSVPLTRVAETLHALIEETHKPFSFEELSHPATDQPRRLVASMAAIAQHYDDLGGQLERFLTGADGKFDQAKNDRIRAAIENNGTGPIEQEAIRQQRLKLLAPDEAAVADLLHAYLSVNGQLMTDVNMIPDFLRNFLPHLMIKEKGPLRNGSTLSKFSTSQIERVAQEYTDKNGGAVKFRDVIFKTADDLQAFLTERWIKEGSKGEEPKVDTNLSTILSAHGKSVSQAIFLRKFIMAAESDHYIVQGEGGKVAYNLKNGETVPSAIRRNYTTVDTGPAAKAFEGYLIYKPVAERLERLTSTDQIDAPAAKLVNKLGDISGLYKFTHFILSFMHLHSMSSNVSSLSSKLGLAGIPSYLQPKVYELSNNGYKIRNSEDTDGQATYRRFLKAGYTPFQERLPENTGGIQSFVERLPIAGPITHAFEKLMWERGAYDMGLGLTQHLADSLGEKWKADNGRDTVPQDVQDRLDVLAADKARSAVGTLTKMDMTNNWRLYGNLMLLANKWTTAQVREFGNAFGIKTLANIGGADRNYGTDDLGKWMTARDVALSRQLVLGGMVRLAMGSLVAGASLSYLFTGQTSTPWENFQRDPAHTFDIYRGRGADGKDQWINYPFYLFQREMTDYVMAGFKAAKEGKPIQDVVTAPFIRMTGKMNPISRLALEEASGRELYRLMYGYSNDQIDGDKTIVNIRKSLDSMGYSLPGVNSLEDRLIYAFQQISPFGMQLPSKLNAPTKDPSQIFKASGLDLFSNQGLANLGLHISGVRNMEGTQYVKLPDGREVSTNDLYNMKLQYEAQIGQMIQAASTGDMATADKLRVALGMSPAQAAQAISHGVTHSGSYTPGALQGPASTGPADPLATLPAGMKRSLGVPGANNAVTKIDGHVIPASVQVQMQSAQFKRENAVLAMLQRNPSFTKLPQAEQQRQVAGYNSLITKITEQQYGQALGIRPGAPISNAAADALFRDTVAVTNQTFATLSTSGLLQGVSASERDKILNDYDTAAKAAVWQKYFGGARNVTDNQIVQTLKTRAAVEVATHQYVVNSPEFRDAQTIYEQSLMLHEYSTFAKTVTMEALLGKKNTALGRAPTVDEVLPMVKNGIALGQAAQEMLHETDLYNGSDVKTQAALDKRYVDLARKVVAMDIRDGKLPANQTDLSQAGFGQLLKARLVADEGYKQVVDAYGGTAAILAHQQELADIKRKYAEENQIAPNKIAAIDSNITKWYDANNQDYAAYKKALATWKSRNPVGQLYDSLAKNLDTTAARSGLDLFAPELDTTADPANADLNPDYAPDFSQ